MQRMRGDRGGRKTRASERDSTRTKVGMSDRSKLIHTDISSQHSNNGRLDPRLLRRARSLMIRFEFELRSNIDMFEPSQLTLFLCLIFAERLLQTRTRQASSLFTTLKDEQSSGVRTKRARWKRRGERARGRELEMESNVEYRHSRLRGRGREGAGGRRERRATHERRTATGMRQASRERACARLSSD